MTHYDPDAVAAEADAVAAFYAERARLLKARDEAYAKRTPPGQADPAWEAAKQEYAEWRTAMRVLAEAAGTRQPGATASYPKD